MKRINQKNTGLLGQLCVSSVLCFFLMGADDACDYESVVAEEELAEDEAEDDGVEADEESEEQENTSDSDNTDNGEEVDASQDDEEEILPAATCEERQLECEEYTTAEACNQAGCSQLQDCTGAGAGGPQGAPNCVFDSCIVSPVDPLCEDKTTLSPGCDELWVDFACATDADCGGERKRCASIGYDVYMTDEQVNAIDCGVQGICVSEDQTDDNVASEFNLGIGDILDCQEEPVFVYITGETGGLQCLEDTDVREVPTCENMECQTDDDCLRGETCHYVDLLEVATDCENCGTFQSFCANQTYTDLIESEFFWSTLNGQIVCRDGGAFRFEILDNRNWTTNCDALCVLPDELSEENTVETCSDGLDNDGDGSVDCNDLDCSGIGECAEEAEPQCEDFSAWGVACTDNADCSSGTVCLDIESEIYYSTGNGDNIGCGVTNLCTTEEHRDELLLRRASINDCSEEDIYYLHYLGETGGFECHGQEL